MSDTAPITTTESTESASSKSSPKKKGLKVRPSKRQQQEKAKKAAVAKAPADEPVPEAVAENPPEPVVKREELPVQEDPVVEPAAPVVEEPEEEEATPTPPPADPVEEEEPAAQEEEPAAQEEEPAAQEEELEDTPVEEEEPLPEPTTAEEAAPPAPVPEPTTADEAPPAPVPEPTEEPPVNQNEEEVVENVMAEEQVAEPVEEVVEEVAETAEQPAPVEEAPPENRPSVASAEEEEEVVFEEEDVQFEVEGEGSTQDELRVLYQAALTKVLLMDLQSPDAVAVAIAARKLDNFFETPDHSVHTDCFCALGGHGLLLMLLQKWKDSRRIQERLFSCLAYLCKWARDNDTSVLSTVLIMRGMDLIADSMARFPDSSKLFVDCLVTITCLSRKEDLDRHTTTHDFITSAVPLVCKAIRSFPEVRDVLLNGCFALILFCKMALNEMKDLKGEAISVVGASLHHFPDDTEINKIAFSFLRNLGSMCGYEAEEEKKEVKEERRLGT